jgi:maleate cis-trans isomerase
MLLGVTVHGQRMWMTNEPNSEAKMGRINADIAVAIRYLSTVTLNLIAYGCITGYFFKGVDWDQALVEMIERVRRTMRRARAHLQASRYFLLLCAAPGFCKMSCAAPSRHPAMVCGFGTLTAPLRSHW